MLKRQESDSSDEPTLDEIKARVGEELHRATSPVVTSADIRKYAIAVYWPEKPPRLFWDEEYAARTIWKGIIAPEDFNPFAWAMAGPGRFPIGLQLGRHRFNALSDAQYCVPIRPGDVIAATEKILDPYERSGGAGHMLFIPTETRWINQRGELVKTHRGEEVVITQEGNSASAKHERKHGTAMAKRTGKIVAKASPRFEEIEEGQAIPPFERTTDLQYWNRFAAVNDEFEYVHMDAEFAKSRGDKDVFAMGHLRFSYMHDFLRLWIGDSGIIRRVSCQYRGIQYRRDTVTCRGTVLRKYVKESECLVDVDLWVENQHGEIIGPGQATVALP